MAEENRVSAQERFAGERFRNSVSRSYYAAYCAATHILAGSVTFGYGNNNPTHKELPSLVTNHLGGVAVYRRRKISSLLYALLTARNEADYLPNAAVGREEAFRALNQTRMVFRLLGWNDE